MTDERFNELLQGPLDHHFLAFRLGRLALALRAVVEECGPAGDQALERICREREEQDRRNGQDD